MWLGVIPGLQLKHLQGGFSKAQICHISNHLFSYTYPLLTAIKLQAGPSSKRPSLSPQFTPQPLPFSGALWWQIKSSLRVVVIYLEQILSTAFDCWRAWSRLCVSFMCCRTQHVCVCVCVCVFAFPALPAIRGEREPALPRDQLPLTHGKISFFLFFFCQASPRRQQCYQLPPRSQPAVSPAWQMTLTSANMRTFSWLTHTPAAEGREVDGWRCDMEDARLALRLHPVEREPSGRQGQVNYLDGIVLRDPCERTSVHTYLQWHFSPLMIGFITRSLPGPRAQPHSCRAARPQMQLPAIRGT